MTPEQVELVKSSWEKVMPISKTAGELFYGRLFELDPSLKELFKKPMDEQINKLFAALNLAVRGLDDLPSIVPVVQELGVKHVAYGVNDKDYDTVGAAFLWTLDKGLGDAFTPDTKEAWTLVYTTVANVMKEAAAAAQKSATA